jgi:glycosyltransferase involved in cell wall biosynthesis
MTDCKLSICIATYNRARYIGETLDSIIPQLTDEIELLVVDGASTDDTESVMNAYSAKCKNLRFVRLPVKGGVDQDYNKAVELARGKMCWLFTDDDLLKPGAVANVIKGIDEGHALIVINAEICTVDLSKTLQSRRLMMEKNTTYTGNDLDLFFTDASVYLTFIGAVIIRRSLWLEREREKYYGTEFIHVGVIFQQPLPGTALIIAEPFIRIRYSNAQWESRRFNIWMFKWPNLLWSFDKISAEAKQKVTPREPWRNLRSLIVQRSDGEYNVSMYHQYLSDKPSELLWKMCAYCISVFPREVITGLRRIYAMFKKDHTSFSLF